MHVRTRRIATTIVALASAALIAAGCGDDNDDDGSKAGSSDDTAAMSDDMDHGGDDESPVRSEAADTRTTMARLLGQHSTLAAIATTRALEGGKDFDAAAAELTENGEELADVVGSVYGDDAQEQFLKEWNDHIGYLVAYTTAAAKGDEAGKKQAASDLAGYVDSFGTFLAEATDLPPEAVKNGLKAHVQHHAGIIDAYKAGNYKQAQTLQRASYEHMVMIGDTLGSAIATQQELDEGTAGDEAVKTRITLGSLLSEHTDLAFHATTSALGKSPDFEQAAASLTANSKDLGDVIESVYGAEARAAFDKQWADHIRYLVDYTTATATDDDAARGKAVEELDEYIEEFGEFLAGATDLPAEAVKNGLDAHVKHHAGSIDAFAAGDYEQAYELSDAGSEHMWTLGDTLSGAIVAQSAS